MPAQAGSLLAGGPDQYWSDTLPPSRGQYRDLALLALRVLGIEEPKSRLEATTAQVRLRAAIEQQQRKGVVGPTPRCGACNAFLRSTSHPCTKCGYLAGRGFVA